MQLHEVHLTLQLVWVGPVVVALAIGYVFATCALVVELNVHTATVALLEFVLRLVEGEHDVRVPLFIFPQYGLRLVGGSVVVNQDFKREGGLLHQESIKALTDKLLVVEGETTDADERCVVTHIR